MRDPRDALADAVEELLIAIPQLAFILYVLVCAAHDAWWP